MRILDWGKKKREFTVVAFDATGQLLMAGGGYQATIAWDTVSGTERARLDPTGHFLKFHSASGRFLFPTKSGLQAYEANTGALTVVRDNTHGYGETAFAPDGDWTVHFHTLGGRTPALTASSGFGQPDQTTLWETTISDSADQSGHVSCLSCLPGGERFLSAETLYGNDFRTNPRRISIRARADGRLLQSSPENVYRYGDRVFGSHLNNAVILQDGMFLRVYRSDDLAFAPRVIRNDNKKHFTGIAFHPSGKYLAATSNDETVKFYDATTWDVARTFTWDVGRMRSIAFSPDGTLAAVGSDTGKLVVWDIDL
jgi:WD40 repeat protein